MTKLPFEWHVIRYTIGRNTELGVATYIPWVFVWSDIQAPVDQPLFGAWNTLGDIEDGVRDTNIGKILSTAVMTGALRLSSSGKFHIQNPWCCSSEFGVQCPSQTRFLVYRRMQQLGAWSFEVFFFIVRNTQVIRLNHAWKLSS